MTLPFSVVALLLSTLSAAPQGVDPVSAERVRALLVDARYEPAEAEARAVLAAARAAGDERAEARALGDLAEVLRAGSRRQTAEAWETAVGALELAEQRFGPASVETARALHELGALQYAGYDDLAGARVSLEHSLELREAALGPVHPDVAMSLIYLANLEYDQTGDLTAATGLFERAREIHAADPATDPLDAAWRESRWATVLHCAGQLEDAERAYRRALEIRSALQRPDHPRIATLQSNLAGVLLLEGRYSSARDVFALALPARRAAYGDRDPRVASTLTAYGELLAWFGHRAQALGMLEEALSIREEVYGAQHARVGESLVRLGSLLVDSGVPARALLLFERALALEGAGPQDPLARSERLHLRGMALHELGQDAAARASLDESIALMDGRTTPYLVDALCTRSELVNPESARVDLARARTLTRQLYGADSIREARVLTRQAHLYVASGERPRAFELARRAERIGREHMRSTARGEHESFALLYALERTTALDSMLALALEDERWVADAWDAVIRGRSLVQDEMVARRRAALASGPTEATTRLDLARRRLADVMVRGPAGDPEDYRRRLEAARSEKGQAERECARESRTWRESHVQAQAGLAEVRRALPAGVALVAFHVHRPPRGGEGASYVGFVVRSGMRPVLVSLGDEESIGALVSDWRAAIRAGSTGGESGSELGITSATAALRSVVWDPLEVHLTGAERVWLVPDHALHLVSFPGLLGDERLTHRLSCERDAVGFGAEAPVGDGLLALGGPDYGALAAGLQVASLDRGAAPSRRADCGDFEALNFGPLPETAKEIEDVARHWTRGGDGDGDVVLLSGPAACEGAFKSRASGRSVLHLATHGFFLGEGCARASANSRGVGAFGPRYPSREELPRGTAGEHPLLRSGLALAGANRRAEAPPGSEDGILTAEEIASLDLSGVQWAVLSACETGLGTVQVGEGVFGLCRAFRLAGARTVITSLWSVDDRATREFMGALYRARFGEGMDTVQAVGTARLEVQRRRLERGESTHPFYWAGFVAVGDWR
jgi:tetratricopeptide (TPR) repeat protein